MVPHGTFASTIQLPQSSSNSGCFRTSLRILLVGYLRALQRRLEYDLDTFSLCHSFTKLQI